MRWMVDITFKKGSESEMAPLVPQEQEHIKELSGRGVVEKLYLSENREHAWLVMQGETQDTIEQELRAFPLYSYMILQVFPLLG